MLLRAAATATRTDRVCYLHCSYASRAQHVVVATRFARFACSVLLWLLPLATRFARFACSVLLRPLATLFARFACSGQRCSAGWPERNTHTHTHTHTHTRHRCLFFISKDVTFMAPWNHVKHKRIKMNSCMYAHVRARVWCTSTRGCVYVCGCIFVYTCW